MRNFHSKLPRAIIYFSYCAIKPANLAYLIKGQLTSQLSSDFLMELLVMVRYLSNSTNGSKSNCGCTLIITNMIIIQHTVPTKELSY
jgi:hypothetical protein